MDQNITFFNLETKSGEIKKQGSKCKYGQNVNTKSAFMPLNNSILFVLFFILWEHLSFLFLFLFFKKKFIRSLCSMIVYIRRKHHFGSYIFGAQSIWSLFFYNSQFCPCYFELAINLISTVNSLMKNAYVANYVHCWHNWSLCSNQNNNKLFLLTSNNSKSVINLSILKKFKKIKIRSKTC